MELGEGTWSRVSLTRTPPFDALNSPSIALRRGSVGLTAPPNMPNPAHHSFRQDFPEQSEEGNGCNAETNLGNWYWVEFFAPPHRMAPAGDQVDLGAISTLGSANTASAASSRSIQSCGESTMEGKGGVHESELLSQVAMGHVNIDNTLRGATGDSEGEVYQRPPLAQSEEVGGEVDASKEHPRWEGEEDSRTKRAWVALGKNTSCRTVQRWRAFLKQAERHFDSEAQIRKQLSLIRHAHPDISNEMAFVALAQLGGRAAEAAAILNQPQAKDEVRVVTMVLDIGVFIAHARDSAERRRHDRQHQRQEQRREYMRNIQKQKDQQQHQQQQTHR
ncbi:unnamed protein product, partial [Choristocarpus tenellus]